MKNYDVICIGEVLVDLISQEPGKGLPEVAMFKKFAGGAPANVAVGLARLGYKTGFAGKVGDDSFGLFLKKFLSVNGVNTDALRIDPVHKTRLAFVEVALNGERSFAFSEQFPADSALQPDDFPKVILGDTHFVHLGSLPLNSTSGSKAYDELFGWLEQENVPISFDPNYRPNLWKTPRTARNILGRFANRAQILKVSLEEAELLCGTNRIAEIQMALFQARTQLLAITLGEKGCILKNRNYTVEVPGYEVTAIDTTGCGDAFTAGLLAKLIQSGKSPDDLTESELIIFGRYANTVAALTATRLGATEAFPTNNEISMIIKSEKVRKEV